MSVIRAKKLLMGMKFHHLGFGFFWAVSFVVLSGFQTAGASSGCARSYLLVEQLVTVVSVVVVALMFRNKRSVLPPWFALVAGFTLSGGALLYFLVFHLGFGNLPTAVAAGGMIGCANALFFLLWQTFFVTEGQQRAIIYIPVSAVLSILLYIMTLFLPLPLLVFATVVVLPFLAMFALHASLGEIELYPIKRMSILDTKQTVGNLWRPVFCVCAVGFVWKLMAQLSVPSTISQGLSAMAVLLGFGAAGLLVALFELFSSRGFEILRMYQILFPLLTGIFLLPTFFGPEYNPFLTGILMFGFETVNLLLLVTCAVYTAKKMYSPIVMYGLCIVPVLAAMAAGDILGSMLSPIIAYDFAHVLNALFVCIYLLSLVLILVSRGRRTRVVAVPAEEDLLFDEVPPKKLETEGRTLILLDSRDAADSDGIDFEMLFREKSLSPREVEVACLLLKGHSVASIARKLFISENTARGHTKSIYRKLDVHSRQQLIDLGEEGFSAMLL